ncbi:hypothetical protein BJ742DRAFT_830996 [Cladochytrium replicatum]|nr:hypothetical protein BJ742DRAFT_830996 [Cladochytrium replicatum]
MGFRMPSWPSDAKIRTNSVSVDGSNQMKPLSTFSSDKKMAAEKDIEAASAWPNSVKNLNTLPRSQKRFCGAHLRKWQCVCLWCLAIFFILLVIMIPLTIKVIIPAVIQYVFSSVPINFTSSSNSSAPAKVATNNTFTITQVSLVNFTNDAVGDGGSVYVSFKAFLPMLSFPGVPSLGLSASLLPRVYVELLSADDNAPLLDIDLLDSSIDIRQDQRLDIKLDPFAVRFRRPSAFQTLLQSLTNAAVTSVSGGNGTLDTINAIIRINQTNFKLLGIPITGVDLERSVSVDTKQLFSFLNLSGGPSYPGSQNTRRTLFRRGNHEIVHDQLGSYSLSKIDIIDPRSVKVASNPASLTLSILSINDLTMTVNGDEVSIKVGGEFAESFGIPLSASIGRLSVDFQLNNQTIWTFLLTGLSFQVVDNSFSITTQILPTGEFKGYTAVQDILKGKYSGMTIGIRNIQISNDKEGKDPVKFLNTAFSIDVTIPFSLMDMVLFSLGTASSSSSSPSSSESSVSSGISIGGVPIEKIFEINSAEIELVQNAAQNWVLNATPNVTISMPIDATVSITGFTLDIYPAATTSLLNAAESLTTLMRIAVPDITIRGSNPQPLFGGASKVVSVEMFSAQAARDAFGLLARSTVDSIASAKLPTAGVAFGGITFGTGTGKLNSITKIMRIPVSLAAFSSGVALSGGTVGAALVSGLRIKVREALLDMTTAGDGLNANVGANVEFRVADGLPGLIVSIPEMNLRTGMDSDDLATVSVTGLALNTLTTKDVNGVGGDKSGSKRLLTSRGFKIVKQAPNLTVSIRFPQALSNSVSPKLQSFMTVPLKDAAVEKISDQDSAVVIRGINFGLAGGSKTLFSDLNLRVTPSFLSRFSTSQSTSGDTSGNNSIMSSLAPVIISLGVSTASNGASIVLEAALNNPGPLFASDYIGADSRLSTNIRTFSTTVQVDDENLVTADVRLAPDGSRMVLNGDRLSYSGIVVNTQFGQGDGIQTKVATLANSFQSPSGLSNSTQRITLTGFRIGNAGANSPITELLSAVKMTLPVSSFASNESSGSTISGFSVTDILPGLKVPLNSGVSAFAPIAIRGASFATLDTGFGLTSSIGITNPLKDITITVGFVRVGRIVLDGSEIGGIELTNITLNRNGAVLLTPGLKVQLQKNANIGNLINALLSGSEVKSTVLISKMEIGRDATSVVTAFSGVEVKFAFALGKSGGGSVTSGSNGDFLKLVQIPSIDGAGIRELSRIGFTVTETGFKTAVDSRVNNPTNFAVDLGYVAARISSASAAAPLVDVSLTNIKLIPGEGSFPIRLVGDLSSTNDVSAEAVASLLDAVQKGGTSGLVLGGVAFGSSRDTAFQVISGAQIAIPLDFNSAGSSAVTSNISNSFLPPAVLESLSPLKASLNAVEKIGFALTDAGFDALVDTKISNPTGISANVPFIGLNVDSADASRIVNVALTGLNLGTGDSPFSVAVGVDLRETNKGSENAVASLFDVINNGGATSLAISGMTFGTSRSQSFKLLSKAKLSIPLKLAPPLPSSNSTAVITGGINLLAGIVDGLIPSGIDGLSFQTQDDRITATVQASLGTKRRSATSVSVEAGFVSAEIKLQGLSLGGFSTENFKFLSAANGSSPLTVPFAFATKLADTAALSDPVGLIANPLADRIVQNFGFGTGQALGIVPDVKLAITNIVFGKQKSAPFGLLSGVEFRLTIPGADIAKEVDGLSGRAGSAEKVDLANILKNFAVDTVQTGFNVDLGLQIPSKSTLLNNLVANVGLFSLSAASGSATLLQMNVSPVSINSGALSTRAGIEFGSTSEAQDEVAKIGDVLLNRAQTTLNALTLKDLKFGTANVQNLLLSKVRLTFDGRKVVSAIPFSIGGERSTVSSGRTIRSLLIPDTLSTLAIKVDLTAKGAAGTISTSLSQKMPDISANLPFASLDAFAGATLSSQSFFTGSLSGTAISKASPAAPASLDATISATAGDFYVNLVTGLATGKRMAITLGNLKFGTSASNPITLFSKVPFTFTFDGRGNSTAGAGSQSDALVEVGSPIINLLPNINVIFKLVSKLPFDLAIAAGLTTDVRFGKADGEKNITTAQVHGGDNNAPITFSEGKNTVKVDVGFIDIGGVIVGGLEALFGGAASVELANIKLQGVDWLNQALDGRDISIPI